MIVVDMIPDRKTLLLAYMSVGCMGHMAVGLLRALVGLAKPVLNRCCLVPQPQIGERQW